MDGTAISKVYANQHKFSREYDWEHPGSIRRKVKFLQDTLTAAIDEKIKNENSNESE